MAFRATERVRHKLLVAWKWTLSLPVRDWEFQHYPVVVRRQDASGEDEFPEPRIPTPTYRAFILRGPYLDSTGDTSQDALDNLRTQFNRWKQMRVAEGKSLPRPGRSIPIEFADSSKIEAHGALTADFIHRVLLLDWALITDESSLWDFHTERDNEHFLARVKDLYGVDVSDIESGNLSLILDRIAEHRRARPPS